MEGEFLYDLAQRHKGALGADYWPLCHEAYYVNLVSERFLREEREAWDTYAAAYDPRLHGSSSGATESAAKFADKLLAERRRRFSPDGH